MPVIQFALLDQTYDAKQTQLFITSNCWLGSVHKYLGGGGGWAKWRGAKKVLSCRKGGTKKFSAVNGGGSKKFGQIESIMKIKMHNLLPKSTGYSLKSDLYFKIFPGNSAGPALHLRQKKKKLFGCPLPTDPILQPDPNYFLLKNIFFLKNMQKLTEKYKKKTPCYNFCFFRYSGNRIDGLIFTLRVSHSHS